MSGIAGIYNLDGRPVEGDVLTRMSAALAHRGPDGEGLWIQGPVGLGHRMLHTTPESLQEKQPLGDETGTLCLTLDGRVDNRDELRAALEAKGAKLRSDTDAELVLRAYQVWGEECPKQILGDFAFVIWDRQHHRLFCTRDPIGVKPFYYYWDGRLFLCASAIEALLNVPDLVRRVNESMIADYLLSDFRDPEATFFKDINQLRPAHYLCLEGRRLRQVRYWGVSPQATISYRRKEDYLDHFRELFREAVRCRLRSHWPVGAMLSGGIDSTLVAAMVEALRQEDAGHPPFAAFSVFEEILQDEWEAIQSLVHRFGTVLHLIRPENRQGPLPLFELFVSRSATPYHHGYYIHPLVFQSVAAQGCRVLLTGIGADELMGIGLSEAGILVDLLRGLRFRSLVREIRKTAWAIRSTKRAVALQMLREALPPRVRWIGKTLFGRQVSQWIGPEFTKRQGLPYRIPLGTARTFDTMCQEKSLEALTRPAWVLALNQLNEAVSGFMVEYRHPFLDRRLIEFFLAVPSGVKVEAGQRKLFAQRALHDIVPGPLRERYGEDCVTPLRDDARSRVLEGRQIEQILGSSTAPIFDYVNPRQTMRLLREFVEGDLTLRTPLWKFVDLARWLQRYFPEKKESEGEGGQISRREPAGVAVADDKGGGA